MHPENKTLIEKYADFRQAAEELEFPVPMMPYDWLHLPKSIDFLSDNGAQKMIFSDLATESARELANSINHLIVLTLKLAAWQKVFCVSSPDEQAALRHEFVQDLATSAITLPYTIKARFFFAVAHLSHQANVVPLGSNWTDSFDVLPEDSGITQQHAQEQSKHWTSWKKLNSALAKADSGGFKKNTEDFRNKHTHRFTPRVDVGITQFVRRIPSETGRPCYGMGGSQPISLDTVVRELECQCRYFSKAFSRFQDFVEEQRDALFPPPTRSPKTETLADGQD